MRFLNPTTKPANALAGVQFQIGRWWRRRSTRVGASALASLVLSGGLAWMVASGAFGRIVDAGWQATLGWSRHLGLDTQMVEIEGRTKTPLTDVVQAIGVSGQHALLSIDLEAMRQRILALPWVEAAEIERRYPDRLMVRIKEYEPFALWQRQQQFYLIARDGHVIEAARIEQYRHLPIVVGKGAPQRAAGILDLIAGVPELAEHVRAAVLVGERRWNLRLDNGIDVKLPELEPALAWARLGEIEREQDLFTKDISVIDLRFEGRIVVRLAHPRNATSPADDSEAGKET